MSKKKIKKEINKEIKKETIQEVKISEHVKSSYIDYAMSVIVSRALPDVRDGLKPVQRRILYTMFEEGLFSGAKFRKSATVVGSCLGRYHPHGDASVYETLVRMAQDFSLRYPLVQGQGNFGSIDGDPAAAQRYTECKLSKIGEEMLNDINKDTVDFIANYDATRKEPVVLPSPFPHLLLNGSMGIAVGMATYIPPHNLSEVFEALNYLIDNPKSTTENLFKFIKGPDFPTGGIICNPQDLINVYSTGQGAIIVRGKAEVEEDKNKRPQIIITEIPFQVEKSGLLEHIANLVEEKKIEGIRNIRDESDRDGMRVVIELSKDAIPQRILNLLYKFSDLQKTFHLNMLALVNGIQPKILNLAEILTYFIEHRKQVTIRRIKYELDRAKERAHILEGLHKCLGSIDEVIRIIKTSKDREDAKIRLIKRFRLSEIQANAILDTRLASLAKLERKKIEDELKELRARIKEYIIILKSPARLKEVIKKEFKEIKDKFSDERKTQIFKQGIKEIKEEDLIPDEEAMIIITQNGYIKRVDPSDYRMQKRGGRGTIGIKISEEDIVEHLLFCSSLDRVFFFTDSGRMFETMAYNIPKTDRSSKGRGILNFLNINQQDKILAVVSIGRKKEKEREKYLIMVTKNGIIKKTSLKEFENIRSSGLFAIRLKKGDSLKNVAKTGGEDELILITKMGQALRFSEAKIKTMSRQATGIKGIRLGKNDEVYALEVVKKEDLKGEIYLFILTEKAFGKKTKLKEYRIQNRGGVGIKTIKITEKIGNIITAKIISDQKELIIMSQKGQTIRTDLKTVPTLSRITQGTRIMKLPPDDKIASAIII